MKVNVCFAIHDKNGGYTKYLGTAIYSVLRNTYSEVTIHIICDKTLTYTYKRKLDSIVKRYHSEIKYYDVSNLKFNIKESQYKRFTIGTLYRLKMLDILPIEVERVIQLDVDIIVNLNIEELYNIDLGDNYLAACVDRTPSRKSIVEQKELSKDSYINVGVVLWNLKKIREKEIDLFNESIKFFSTHPHVRLPDEEAVNVIFRNRIKYLKSDYNFPAVESRKMESEVKRKIYHFCADVPRDFDVYAIDELFMKTLERTNWYGKKDFLSHYIKRIREIERKKENVVNLFKSINNVNTIIIWGVKGDIHPMIMDIIYRKDKRFMYVDSDERLWGKKYRGEIIEPPNILEKHHEDLIISTIFRYNEVHEVLAQYGYEENVNYFDGKQLLKEEAMAKLWGERNNPWDL